MNNLEKFIGKKQYIKAMPKTDPLIPKELKKIIGAVLPTALTYAALIFMTGIGAYHQLEKGITIEELKKELTISFNKVDYVLDNMISKPAVKFAYWFYNKRNPSKD